MEKTFGCKREGEKTPIDCLMCIVSNLEEMTHNMIGRIMGVSMPLGLSRALLLDTTVFDERVISFALWMRKNHPEKWKYYKKMRDEMIAKLSAEERRRRETLRKQIFGRNIFSV